MKRIINKLKKNKKYAFTLIEMLIVIIIMGILIGIYNSFSNKLVDINSVKSLFVNNMLREILKNKVEHKGGYYYDISSKYCPNQDFNNCDWDSEGKCIIGKFKFDELPDNTIELKKMIKGITKYEICPKFLPDGTLNTEYVGKAHQNPSFMINFKMNNVEYKLIYPEY